MTRKLGIIVSLVMALVFTGLIVHGGNRAYQEAVRTVQVVVTTRDIPANVQIRAEDVTLKEVPEVIAGEMLTSVDAATGKVAQVTLLKGQYVTEHALRTGTEIAPGHVGVTVAVDLAGSAAALAGERVDIHAIDRGLQEERIAPAVVRNVLVLRTLLPDGKDKVLTSDEGLIKAPTGQQGVAALTLQVPQEIAETVVFFAAQKGIYLVKSDPARGEEAIVVRNRYGAGGFGHTQAQP